MSIRVPCPIGVHSKFLLLLVIEIGAGKMSIEVGLEFHSTGRVLVIEKQEWVGRETFESFQFAPGKGVSVVRCERHCRTGRWRSLLEPIRIRKVRRFGAGHRESVRRSFAERIEEK